MADHAPDITKLPNFTAVQNWIDKLIAWCEDARAEIGMLEGKVRRRDEEVERLEDELRDPRADADALERLEGAVRDLDRGIITAEELKGMVPAE